MIGYLWFFQSEKNLHCIVPTQRLNKNVEFNITISFVTLNLKFFTLLLIIQKHNSKTKIEDLFHSQTSLRPFYQQIKPFRNKKRIRTHSKQSVLRRAPSTKSKRNLLYFIQRVHASEHGLILISPHINWLRLWLTKALKSTHKKARRTFVRSLKSVHKSRPKEFTAAE